MSTIEARAPHADPVRGAAYQAFWLLRVGFTVAPIIGAPLVAAWLAGIIVNLLTNNPPEYYDIALRDFGLMLAALTLTRLAWAVARERARPARQSASEERPRVHVTA